MARILEELPDTWTVELLNDDEDFDARDRFDVRAIPTFVVQDAPGGREPDSQARVHHQLDSREHRHLAVACGQSLDLQQRGAHCRLLPR